MNTTCGVCGQMLTPADVEHRIEIEQETYIGDMGCQMTLEVWYCNKGAICSAVAAANKLDEVAETFFSVVGTRE